MAGTIRLSEPVVIEKVTIVGKTRTGEISKGGKQYRYEYGRVSVLVPSDWIGRRVKVIIIPIE